MIDLAATASSGAIAGQILTRADVKPPMITFALKDAEHQHWTSSFYGGWCDADPRAVGLLLPVVSLDVSSCFPLVAHLLGWWSLVYAQRIQRIRVAVSLRRLCELAIVDPRIVLDPVVWREWGCTLVEVIPRGELWPVELEDRRRPDGRMELTRVHSPNRSFFYPWADVVHAAMQSRTVPTIVGAVNYRPIGRQAGIRQSLRVRPDLLLDLGTDPGVALVRYRRLHKDRGDLTLAAQLRQMVNALVYGNFCRFDPIRLKVDGTWVNGERPGPWNCMPIASTVTAGSRLLLGVLDRLVRDADSLVLYRDTDSSIIPATPGGGDLILPGEPTLRCLSWAEVDRLMAAFDPLSPSPDWPVWQVTKGTK